MNNEKKRESEVNNWKKEKYQWTKKERKKERKKDRKKRKKEKWQVKQRTNDKTRIMNWTLTKVTAEALLVHRFELDSSHLQP